MVFLTNIVEMLMCGIEIWFSGLFVFVWWLNACVVKVIWCDGLGSLISVCCLIGVGLIVLSCSSWCLSLFWWMWV